MRAALFATILLILCAMPALGATLSGTAYTADLQVAKYSLLQINTTPVQRILLDDGTYSINVPQGSYLMTVTYTRSNQQYEDELTVTVADDGTYNYDFILFPSETNSTQALPVVEDVSIPEQKQAHGIGTVPAIILLILLIAGALYLGKRRWWESRRSAKGPDDEADAGPSLPADLEGIVSALKAEGGRATQKELRKRIPCSEAKMSMMLTELEHKGRIERIKKGRGNLIVLK